jgi:hypothetical protein
MLISMSEQSESLHVLRYCLELREAECRRLRYYLALQKDAIAALESALRFLGPDLEPAKGALAILGRCREQAASHTAASHVAGRAA